MKKLTAILGIAAIFGGLAVSHPALAYQAASTATQATPATAPMTPEEKKAARAEKRAAKAAAKNAAPATTTATPAPSTAAGVGGMSGQAPARTPSSMGNQPPPSTMGGQTAGKAPKSSMAKPVTPTATPAQIADAKAKGMVWVNKSSKVYHKSDDRYFGATKTGEFMTEADAQKAGAHLAK